ncbi:hypothetical protein FPV67DRAFT_1415160 [Lyophyllum atratum]|nr:hypothetical protein FPV67DRAFT_1415160 [Lyophyllum atratum]
MSEVRGLPLLSGPPPSVDSGDSCRKCNKEFNMFLSRSRKCNHCGYSYCHNCSDYQAMMPRGGQEAGYDSMHVCAFCIEFLNVTAAGKGILKAMPLSKLKKYVDAYNIKIDRAVEKDDLIDGMLRARNREGCLPRDNENYYRKYSVPNRSTSHTRSRLFSRPGQSSHTPTPPPPPRPVNSRPAAFPRPDLAPDTPPHHHQRQYAPPPGPPPHQAYPHQSSQVPPRSRPYNHSPHHPQSYPNTQYPSHPQGSHSTVPPPPVPPQASRPQHQGYPHQTPPRPRAATAAPPPAVTPPTLDQLLDMPIQEIGSLSIGALKSILFTNHVNAGMILEKGELVAKVKVLVEDERRDRDRQRAQEEAEEAERIERQREMLEEHSRAQREREERIKAEQQAESGDGDQHKDEGTRGETEKEHASGSSPAPSSIPPRTPPKPRGTAADLERTGLCVICQDDEANIAIVDCGHLAMCRGCSDLVMASSRECPLCRTRIVTEARLLRIFKS